MLGGYSTKYPLPLLEIYCFSGYYIASPLLLLLLLFCSHPFFWLNAFYISGIKPLFRILVRKYAEGKGPMANSVCGWTTLGRGLLLSLLFSRQDIEQTMALNSFFFYFSTATESGCLLGKLWPQCICFGRYNSTLKSWIPLFTSRQERADEPYIAGNEIVWFGDLWFNFEKLNSRIRPNPQHMRHIPGRNYVL